MPDGSMHGGFHSARNTFGMPSRPDSSSVFFSVLQPSVSFRGQGLFTQDRPNELRQCPLGSPVSSPILSLTHRLSIEVTIEPRNSAESYRFVLERRVFMKMKFLPKAVLLGAAFWIAGSIVLLTDAQVQGQQFGPIDMLPSPTQDIPRSPITSSPDTLKPIDRPGSILTPRRPIQLPEPTFGPMLGPSRSRQTPNEAVQPPAAAGLQIRVGDLIHPENERLAVRDDNGNRVVGRYLVGSGSVRFVLMPDGRLKVFDDAEVSPTEDAFTPMTIDEVRDRWLADERLAKLEMKSIQSRHFLFLYNTSEPFIRATRTILETMYPAVRKYFQRTRIDTHEPEFPLVIVAFANDHQFQEFNRMPEGVVAYYDSAFNNVALYEQSRLNQVAPQVAVMNSISTIAHEGVHQILYNIGVQQRLSQWPMWLSEGLPEFFAPTSTGEGARWKGLGATNDLRMKEIFEDVKSGRRLGDGSHLKRLVESNEFDSQEYAYAWGVIHWMARKQREELFASIREASTRKPLAHLTENAPDNASFFQKHLGDDFVEHEKDLARHLLSIRWVDPAENQVHYLVISGSRVTLTTSPERVEELRRATLPLQKFRVQRFRTRTLAMQAMSAITQ